MKLLLCTAEAFREAKKERAIGKSIIVLIIAAVIAAIAAALLIQQLERLPIPGEFPAELRPAETWTWLFLVFLAVAVFGFFGGLLVKTAMTGLGYKTGYFEGLTVLAYPLLPFSVGLLIAVALNFIPIVGVVIAFFLLALFVVIACTAFFRGVKELFGSDYLAAIITVMVVWAAIYVAFLIAALGIFRQLAGLFPEMIPDVPRPLGPGWD